MSLHPKKVNLLTPTYFRVDSTLKIKEHFLTKSF